MGLKMVKLNRETILSLIKDNFSFKSFKKLFSDHASVPIFIKIPIGILMNLMVLYFYYVKFCIIFSFFIH